MTKSKIYKFSKVELKQRMDYMLPKMSFSFKIPHPVGCSNLYSQLSF